MALNYQLHKREIQENPSNITLREAIDLYIKSKQNILSPSTIRGYTFIRNNAFKSIMDLKINQLTSNQIQLAVNQEALTKSPKTLRNEFGLISVVIRTYSLTLNLSSISLPQKKKFQAELLTLKQVETLMGAIENDSAEIPLYLAACLGLRSSEINGLMWKHFDAENHRILIEQALVLDKNNRKVVKGTKTTYSTRWLSVPKFLFEKLYKLSDGKNKNDYIVTISMNTVRCHLNKICTDKNIPHIRLHDLRHINASIMLLLNIPQKYAMERGGWDNIQTMDKIYQYTFTDEKAEVDNKINRFFEEMHTKVHTKN